MAPTNHHSHLFWNQFPKHFGTAQGTSSAPGSLPGAVGRIWRQGSHDSPQPRLQPTRTHAQNASVRGSRFEVRQVLQTLFVVAQTQRIQLVQQDLGHLYSVFIRGLSSQRVSMTEDMRDASYWLHWWFTDIFSIENRISLQFLSSHPGNVMTQKHNHLGSYRSQKHPCLELPETRRQLLNQSRKFLIPWNRKTDYSLNEREQHLTQYATRNGICKRNKQHISNITKKLQDA